MYEVDEEFGLVMEVEVSVFFEVDGGVKFR